MNKVSLSGSYYLKKSRHKHFFSIIRIISFLLFTLILSSHAVNSNSQNARVTVRASNTSLKEVLNTIEKQTDYLFVYNINVNTNLKVEVNATNQPVKQILDALLPSIGLSYVQEGSYIVVSSSTQEGVNQQKVTITGIVTDANGEPVIGANVVEKGTTNGTITDIDGKYSLETSLLSVLQVSYIGYNSQEITVKNRKAINIQLKEDTQAIDEVIVVGYGVQRKGNLTGSVSAIKTEKLTAAPIANVTNALAGQLPGLLAKQNSGQPGSDGASLSIRGFGNPLVIVDGVESEFSNIDPNQIESISILKDGAASIYGARAGNGVILVTTKRGQDQKPTISYNGSFTLQGVTDMVKPASSGQRTQMEREAYLQSGQPEAGAPWTAEAVEKFFAGNDPAYPDTDWFDYVFRAWAPQQNHNLSVRGGSSRIKYMGYFGYTDQQTMIKKNGGDYKRYNIQSNMDAAITDRINLSVDLTLTYEDRNFPVRGMGNDGHLWQDLYNTKPWYPAQLPDPAKLAWGGIDVGSIAATSNAELTGYNHNKRRDLRGSVSLSYDFKHIKGLKAKAFVNYIDDEQYVKEFTKPIKYYTYNTATDTYNYAGNFKEKAELRERMYRTSILTQQYSLTYSNLFNETHRVSGLALFESIDYANNNFMAYRKDFLTPSIEQLYAGSTSGMSNDGSAGEMGRASLVMRINYAFKDRYLVETILRADASAKFPSDSRWGYFPGISLGWVASQEDFFKSLTFVDDLKLRVSYGQSGNDAVGNFQYLSGYSMRGTYLLGDAPISGLYSTGLANPLLTWEKMSIYNGGIDFSFLGRKVHGSIEGFYRQRDGIPATRIQSLPSTFGSALPPENLNSLNDRGFELNLGTAGKTGNFSYDVSGNISWSRSKWDTYEEPDYEDPEQKRINQLSGQWTDRIFGYVSEKLFTSQEEIDALKYTYSALGGNHSLRPGDIKYSDLNEDGVLDWKDQKDIGMGTMPHWMYGFSVELKYRDFDLSALFQGAFGYYTNAALGFETEVKYKERWTQENNNANALIPRLGGSTSNGWTSDYYYKSTSYLRLKNASLGYNVPKKILDRVGVNQVRLYVAGTNLFTVSNIRKYGIDPEVPNIGNKLMYYPQQRTFSFGLNLSF